MPTLSQVLIGITQKAERLEVGKKLGQLVRGALRNRRNMDEMLSGIEARMAFHEEETSSWLLPEQVRAGESGPFDTLDLGVWLEIAEKAGVAAVPAIPILTLTEDEASLASGSLNLSGERSQRLLGKIAKLLPTPQQPTAAHDEANVDAVLDKLFDAMDKVPEGWMVRHARSGGSNLKALAGAGVAGSTAPEVRFNANLEVGPGWVRVGNRRRVDVTDMRTIKVIAEGPSRPSTFYARPWVQASRWRIGDDPHRHGTVFAGKGRWPCEWRVYVKKGKVIGVANYYGWLGDATPLDARMALKAKAKAELIVAAMKQQRLYPRYMDTEFYRLHPQGADLLKDFGREEIACTLDFIETADGLLLLEGGPAHTPFGGGHSCAFSGANGLPTKGKGEAISGVAFRLLDGVILADMDTWAAGLTASRDGRIVSFHEAERLAAA